MPHPEPRFTIRPATLADAQELSLLFDQYRVFYEQASDLAAAQTFVTEQIRNAATRFFLAARGTQPDLLAFVHLIPSVSTLHMRPMWYLEDLFVIPSARRQGVARDLMLYAEQFARDTKAERLTLATAHDNHAAQALYLSLGYVREDHFWYFHRLLP